MGRLFIVRHGNTFDKGDEILRVGCRTDLPLSQSGVAQAKALQAHFADARFNAAFHSPLKRTRETLAIILADHNLPMGVLDALNEVDYGPDEGRPESEVIARVGQAALDRWSEEAVPCPDWQVDVASLRENWSVLLAAPKFADGDHLLCTSNGTARFVLDVIADAQTAPKKLRTGAYGIVTTGKTPRLIGWDIRP